MVEHARTNAEYLAHVLAEKLDTERLHQARRTAGQLLANLTFLEGAMAKVSGEGAGNDGRGARAPQERSYGM